jgi:general secretion pathway protein G
MQRYTVRNGKTKRGFTLIELLIVIAIILILIAIALPNFLEAQIRAKVAASRANMRSIGQAMETFRIDMGDFYADFNDYYGGLQEFTARTRARGDCNVNPVCSCYGGGIPAVWRSYVDFRPSLMAEEFYAPGIHCPLTTPIVYIAAAETADPFGAGVVPHGYDSLPESIETQRLHYAAVFGIGPDHIAGHWRAGTRYALDFDGDGWKEGVHYNPTNGSTSHGDFWRVIANNTWAAKSSFEPLIW